MDEVLVPDPWRIPMKRLMTPIALALAALGLAAGGSLAGPAASADAHYLRTDDYLHFPALAPGGEEFHYRKVRLKEGEYTHGAYFANQFHRTDPDLVNEDLTITRTGTYRWRIHRWWSTQARKYLVSSLLTRNGHFVTKITSDTFLNGAHNYGDGWYELGGRIVWDGPLDVTSPQRP
jgi:hypothetical protein